MTLHERDQWPQGQYYKIFNMDLCPDCNFVVLCHRFTIFGAWLHYHSTLSASIHLFLQIRVGLDVDIPFGTWVYHQSIGRCFAYLHDLYITLNFDLKVKVISFITLIRAQAINSLIFSIDMPYLAHGCITMRQFVKCYVFLSVCLCSFVFRPNFFFLWCRRIKGML